MSNETRVFGRLVARELDPMETASVSGGLANDGCSEAGYTYIQGQDGKWIKGDIIIP